ncbi:hypothetical protein, partial [Stenotrophomonas maltophilia]|uniref:hypothetical protein n=1 Tax=Stenotrophomonas maltophilia TaxID=40324 RepID=UPI003BF8653D
IGALMLPWALASAIAITASKRLLARFGPATVLRTGMLLQASGRHYRLPTNAAAGRTCAISPACIHRRMQSTHTLHGTRQE